jgi:futalosine hydrolase
VLKTGRILLLAATSGEIESFIPQEKQSAAERGELTNAADGLTVLITGPGIPATLVSLTEVLCRESFDLVINAGIAGSFRPDWPAGKTVNVVQDSFAELGGEKPGQFTPLYYMHMAAHYRPSFMDTNSGMSNLNPPPSPALDELDKARGITVQTISGRAERIRELISRTHADVESMEGAAVFYTCQRFRTACIQIRAVSNYIHPDHLDQWDISAAIESLRLSLKQILNEI